MTSLTSTMTLSPRQNPLLIVWLLATVWTCSAAGGPGESTAGPALVDNTRPIVLFGDSTTAPRGKLKIYGEQLKDWLLNRNSARPVINAGVPGNTTKQARSRLQRDVLIHNPGIAVIQFGINDAAVDVWKDPPATGPRVGLEDFEQNLRYFVVELKKTGCVVILMTPNKIRWTPTLREMFGKPPYLPEDEDGLNTQLERYAQKIRDLARSENTPLIDVYAAYAEKPGSILEGMLSDGMHPNTAGHTLVYELLISQLEDILPP